MQKYKQVLSVIVPVYNAEATIKRCLESILSQIYKNFELILVDDGSTDQSGRLCEEYAKKDNRINVIHIKNSGPFQARKLGAKKAIGEVLTFADADDWLERDAFAIIMELFCKYDPDILAYTYDYGEGIEKHLYEERLYCNSEIENEIIPGMMYDSALGRRKLNPSLCCKIIKKKLFKQVTEAVEDRVTLGEDALVTYAAVCMARSIYICNKALYHYSSNEFSCTHIYPMERIIELKAFQDNITRMFEEAGILDKERYQIDNYMRSFIAMMVRNWYGIELSPMSFCIPSRESLKGARVVIYGAGRVGKSYVNELRLTGCASIVGWVDRNYKNMQTYNQVNIIAPDQITKLTFDIILIAVWNDKPANDIKQYLLDMGIPESKIFWKRPISIT